MMTRTFNALLWLLPLGLCGCPSNETCTTAPDPTPDVPFALLVTGERVEMSLTPFENSGGNCAPTDVLPESLTAEITGPDGQPVPNEAFVNLPNSILGTLRFTPEKPGLHHFLAAFEPVGGLQQFDLHVARDRSAEATVTSLPDVCSTLERTDRGSLVCNARVFRADKFFLMTLPEGKSAVAGNVVWVAGPTRLERYVDTGTKLELSASLSHTDGSAAFLLASPDELLVLYAQSLQRITFNGTALVSTGRTAWAGATVPVNSQGPQGLLLRTGARLALVSRAPASESQGLWACAYQLDAAGPVRTPEPCQSLSGTLLGYERSVLWMGTSPAGTSGIQALHRLEWTGSQLETRGSLFVGPSLGVSPGTRGSTAVPVLKGLSYELRGLPPRAGVPVYLPEQGLLVLEALDTEIDDPQASSTLFWGLPQSGGPRMRLRPSSP